MTHTPSITSDAEYPCVRFTGMPMSGFATM